MICIRARFVVLSLLLGASTCVAAPKANKAADAQLFRAADRGDVAGVRSALSLGANVNVRSDDGDTPLMVQLQAQWFNAGDLPIVRALLRAGADANARGKGGRTALMIASQLDWIEASKLLLQRGARTEARDSQNRTPLMHAAYGSVVHESSTQCSSPASVRLLLLHGAKVNERDSAGQTALVWAAKTEVDDLMPGGGAGDYHQLALESARLLLSRGADPNMVSKNGNTAIKWARLRRHSAMVKLLEQLSLAKRASVLL